jgi:2-dehydro-3-deoxyphosphogluconate aldolase / (4S)-4-hydroxy-2-oxoglutarate aldolase
MTALEIILAQKIVAIIRLAEYSRAVEVTEALLAGGISVLEFTLTGKGALEAIATVRKSIAESVCVGAGTVMKPDDALAAIDHGAQFVVTPTVRKHVISACLSRATLVLSGGFTPTELLEAYESGSELVKLFPARLAGPKYIQDLLAPLPFLKLVPTGGVSAGNARDYLDAGAAALGIGGNLVSGRAVAAGDWASITAAAADCLAAVTKKRE